LHHCFSTPPKDLSWVPFPLAGEEEAENYSHGRLLPLPPLLDIPLSVLTPFLGTCP
jgi:hypothetical protein